MENKLKPKFYETTWFMWVMLVFFAPVGIFLMWKYNKLNKTVRIVVTVVFGLYFIGMLSSNNSNKSNVVNNTAVTTPKSNDTSTNDQAKKDADTKAQTDAKAKTDADAKAKADAEAKKTADAKAKADAEAKAIIKISSADLSKAYEDNEVKADKDYKGKVADITGAVDSIGVTFGQTYVVLSSGKEYSITGIQCYFDDKAEINKIADLKKGDTVTIEGKVDGKSLNVSVKKCILK